MDNIDVNYHHTTRHQVLAKYSTALKQLRSFAEKNYELRPFVFDNYLLFTYFQRDSSSSGSDEGFLSFSPMTYLKMELLTHIMDRRRQIMYWLFYLMLVLLCVFVYRHETSASDPEYKYMRMWRRMTLPLIERFPRLTELYDESCLMGNPFFQLDDLSCSPCAHVEGVMDLTISLGNSSSTTNDMNAERSEDDGNIDGDDDDDQYGDSETPLNKQLHSEYVPFVFKTNLEPIELQDFHNIYVSNHEIFQRDAYRVQSTNPDVNNLEELFNQFNQSIKLQAHNLWRCNRMLPARLLRQLIARPTTLPSSLAMERFMTIDTKQAPSYTLPDTECPHIYIQQALGTRFIILRPTSECRHRCRTLSMRLPQSFVLSYNWWYWKPISAPDPVSDSMSISLIGSYC